MKDKKQKQKPIVRALAILAVIMMLVSPLMLLVGMR